MEATGTIIISGVIDGRSIVSANVWYAISNIPKNTNGQEPADEAFTYDDFPTGNLTPGMYVWQATVVTFSDGQTEVTGKMCLGATTDFLQGTEVYATSQSGTNPPDDGTTNWKTTYTRQQGYYLWTATRVTYTNGTVAYLSKKCVGYWGTDGNGIVSTVCTYAISAQASTVSDTIAPSDITTWSAASPATTEAKPYLWAKEVVTYTKATSTTKYYMIGARGQNGIDAQDIEWAYIRTKTNTAPVIATDSNYTDSKGKAYTADDHLPHVTGNSNIESNNSGVSGKTYECTDDPKGVNDTWPYEWEIKREKGAADANGHRAWQPYIGTMTLHNNLAASLLTIDIDNDSDQFGVDADGKVLAQQARSTVVTMAYGTEPQTFTSAPTASLRYDDGATVPTTVATADVAVVANTDNTQYRVTVTVKATGTNTPVFGKSGKNGLYVDISGTCARGTKSVRFSLTKVMGGASGENPVIWQLNPSRKSFVFGRDASNNLIPASVASNIYVTRTEGNTTTEHTSASGLTSAPTFSWGFDSESTAQASGQAIGTPISIRNTQAASHSSVWVKLSTGDRETLPILKDGAKGDILSLRCSAAVVSFKEDSQGVVTGTPATYSLSLVRTVGETTTVLNAVPTGYSLKYKEGADGEWVDGQSLGTLDSNSELLDGQISELSYGLFKGSTLLQSVKVVSEWPEKGDKGADAPYNEHAYALSRSRTSHADDDLYQVNNVRWFPSAPDPMATHPYVWERIMHYTAAGVNDQTSYICLTGAVGAMGKLCYIAGEYRADVEYTSNDSQTVAVEVSGTGETTSIYYLNDESNVVDGRHIGPTDSGQTIWVQGMSQYNLVRARYLFADFAQFGAAVVSGDWLISVHGTINGTAYEGKYTDPATYINGGDEKPTYFWFDPAYPNEDHAGKPQSDGGQWASDHHNFIPHYAVNLLTGKSYQNEAYIRGEVHATSGDFENVKISGGIRSPFTFVDPNGTFSTDLSEHMSILTSTGSTLFNLPWDVSQSGRRITIVNYMWGSLSYTTGWAKINVPSLSQFFFEDGAQKTSLIVACREVVELLGYGSPTKFEGWIVMNRLNISTGEAYGHPQLVLAKGFVTGGSSPTVSGKAYTGAEISVSRTSAGHYQLYTNPAIFPHNGGLMAIATGMGTVSNNPVSANVVGVTGQSVNICTFTSAGYVDGDFSFMIMNADDVKHLGFQ